MLPGAPYFALCVSVTLVIKKCYEKAMRKRLARRNQSTEPSEDTADPSAADPSAADLSADTKTETEETPS